MILLFTFINKIEFVTTAREMRGYVQTGEVTLNCDLHGYQSSLYPPVWLDLSGSEITTSAKYTFSIFEGPHKIILENGTTVPSIILSIIIHNISPADEGNYTCRGARGAESVTQLIIVLEGTTVSPITLSHLTTSFSPTNGTVLHIVIFALHIDYIDDFIVRNHISV